ncbi:MAG: TonB family protein [Syntrophaceae bacterium]|nr:TonB family protein [Syntrophaceae bacterium]
MTNIRLPSRQRNIRIPLLMSAALHIAVAATLLLAAAESSLPRLLKAEGPNLSVSWISVVPAIKEAATAPAGRAAPRVSAPAVSVPETEAPSRPKENNAAPEAVAAERMTYVPAALTATGESRAAGISGLPASAPSGRGTSGAVPTAALPRYRNNARPSYPLAARLRGYEGMVLLSVEVSADGRVDDLMVKRSSGYEVLDRSALDAVRTWTFEPARRMGQPVRMRVDIPVKFVLHGQESLS